MSGLTGTHANVTEKGEYRATCAELGLILVAPDTSPRGETVPTVPAGDYGSGLGAGFYVDATQAPFASHYSMWTYVTEELPAIIVEAFPSDMARQAITGQSMGGQGALTIGLTFPDRFRSVSAFAPIVAPMQVPWDERLCAAISVLMMRPWRRHDTVASIEDGARRAELLVEQGAEDTFLFCQLKSELLGRVCADAGMDLTLNVRLGYDHSYYFISIFMADHLRGWAKGSQEGA